VKLETRVGLFILVAIGAFLYLSISIRALRLVRDKFHLYRAYFDDTGGLAVKASVKIAGVEVGWIEEIKLLDDGKAEVIIQVNRSNKLARNAYAMIHQDGLIGNKVLVVDPGDPSTGYLMPGGTLSMPGRTPASVGEILDQFRDIATSIHEIAGSFKAVFASRQGEDDMRQTLSAVTKASDRIADFSVILQRTMKNNEDQINNLVSDFRDSMGSLKSGIPSIVGNVNKLTDKFSNAGVKAGSAFEQVEEASIHAKDTFRETSNVMEKVNNGKGTIGKLINEDETYGDLKKTIHGLKNYVSKTQSLMLNIDMHAESMLRNYNSKGYFELRLRPNSDFFYLFQLVADKHGSISRQTKHITRHDEKGDALRANDLAGDSRMYNKLERQLRYPDSISTTVQTQNDILFGLQFGKRFDRLAFRLGLFESTFGIACDYYVPLKTDKVHWITTLEAFDFGGTKRYSDPRPHVKWLNKVYFMRNLYTSFGVDDMYSRSSASPFWGGGLRFGDDDLKYFLSFLPLGKASGK